MEYDHVEFTHFEEFDDARLQSIAFMHSNTAMVSKANEILARRKAETDERRHQELLAAMDGIAKSLANGIRPT